MQDAGNLGWKLAAQVHGWAPEGLLDTYHSERHPVGERLLVSTRAQQALARPGEHVTALRELIAELLKNDETRRHIVEMVTSVEIQYQTTEENDPHPLVGKFAPNLSLDIDGRKAALPDLMHRGGGVVVDIAARLRSDLANGWADRVDIVRARCENPPPNVDVLIIRPDGYLAEVVKTVDDGHKGLTKIGDSLAKWFGAANQRGCAVTP